MAYCECNKVQKVVEKDAEEDETPFENINDTIKPVTLRPSTRTLILVPPTLTEDITAESSETSSPAQGAIEETEQQIIEKTVIKHQTVQSKERKSPKTAQVRNSPKSPSANSSGKQASQSTQSSKTGKSPVKVTTKNEKITVNYTKRLPDGTKVITSTTTDRPRQQRGLSPTGKRSGSPIKTARSASPVVHHERTKTITVKTTTGIGPKNVPRSPKQRTEKKKKKRPVKESDDVNLAKSMVIGRKDPTLFEKLDNRIILDTNTLQSIAHDLVKGSNEVDKSVIGEDMAKKLVEIEKHDDKNIDDKALLKQTDEPLIVSSVAAKVVEALTSRQVLGKVLTPEEAGILNAYFSRKTHLSEKVLETLDIALDKILRRAHEFYDNKAELNAFLKNREAAKAMLLDALIAKKSDFLADLMSDANFYADMISKGLVDAYQLAAKGIVVLRENLEYLQAAAEQGYNYSIEMANKGMVRGKELAQKGSEAVTCGLNAAQSGIVYTKEMADAGKVIAYDAAMKGHQTVVKGSEKLSESIEAASRSADQLAKKVATACDNAVEATIEAVSDNMLLAHDNVNKAQTAETDSLPSMEMDVTANSSSSPDDGDEKDGDTDDDDHDKGEENEEKEDEEVDNSDENKDDNSNQPGDKKNHEKEQIKAGKPRNHQKNSK